MNKLLLTLSLGALTTLSVASRDFTYQGVNYTTIDDTTCQTKPGVEYVCGGNSGLTGALELPETAYDGDKGYKLVKIGDYSFYDCDKITSVVLPEGLTTIGSNGFKTCMGMTSIVLPESLTTIGEWAFYLCVNLDNVTVPEGVTSLGDFTFRSCVGLASIKLPSNLKAIPRFLFAECFKLSTIDIPAEVVSIGNFAFSGCKILNNVVVPDKVEYIGLSAFAECPVLDNITLGRSVEKIDENAFYSCPKLTEIVLPNSVDSIMDEAFRESALKKVVMGSNIASIGRDAFFGCPLKEVYITTQTPPATNDGSFSVFNTLYVQGDDAAAKYAASEITWARFEIETMTEPSEMTGSKTEVEVERGATVQLSASLVPTDVDLPYIYWFTSNPEVANVDRNGLVTVSDDADGECVITAATLYANGPTREFTIKFDGGDPSGVEVVESSQEESQAPVRFYDLSGRHVDNPAHGLYIKVQGDKATKEIIR